MKRKKIALCTYLIFAIVLCLLFAKRFLPFNSYGADDTKVVLESKLHKYINYNLSKEDRGTLVQYEIKTKLEYGEEVFPVSQRKMQIKFNPIDGQYPHEVKMLFQDASIEGDYQYDETTGILQMQSNNQNEENCFVIANYPTYTEENIERDLEIKVISEVTLADEGNRKITSKEQYNNKVTENIGELTSITSRTQDLYNGYMKSNQINGTSYTSQYQQEEQICISKKEEQPILALSENNIFIKQEAEEIKNLGNDHKLVYKSTQIHKVEMEKLLGKEGILEIFDADGNTIATIGKETEFNEEGTFTIVYEKEPETIMIKTSQIKTEGILTLNHTKEIKDTVQDLENVGVKTIIQIQGVEKPYEIINQLKEAETTVRVDSNNTNWTNQNQNEIIFDISFNSSERKNNLFKNPTLSMELPSQVEKVILGESSLVYANGLELQKPYVEINKNGNNVIVINLLGEQTQYDENSLGLITNVKIQATVILKNEIENTKENIHVTYTNQYTLDGSTEVGNKEIPVQLENYREENKNKVEQPLIYNTAQLVTQNVSDLKLEVAPTKGDTTLQNGDILYEGEYIKYNLKVTNTSSEDLENVRVVATIPEGVTYGELEANYYDYRQKYQYHFQEDVREKTIEIGTIKAGETMNCFYEVKVNDLIEGEESKSIATNIKSYVGEQSIQNYDITNTVKPSEVELFLSSLIDYGNWCYDLNIKSEHNQEVTVKLYLPKGFELDNITYVDHIVEDPSIYNPTGNPKIVYKVGLDSDIRDLEIEVSEDNIITTKLKTNSCYGFFGNFDHSKIQKNESQSTIELTAYAEAIIEEKNYRSNQNRIEKSYQNVSVSMKSPNNGEKVRFEEKIDYEITIQNTGGENVLNTGYTDYVVVNLSDFLPEEVNPVTVTYDYWKLEESETGIFKANKMENRQKDISGKVTDQNGNKIPNVDLSILIPKGETAKVKVETTAGMVFEETKIENVATISGSEIDGKTTNKIAHTILPYNYGEEDESNPDDSDNPNHPDDPNTPDSKNYSITGVAWLDQNENGQRNLDEPLLEGMTVLLMDVSNCNEIKSRTKTDHNGKYQFSNLQQGNYLIVFKYDTNEYKLTEYQKVGVSSSLNSDAFSKIITLLGNQEKVGITDSIPLRKSVTNIDIGLIENKRCDFKIDKYINKITIKTAKGTKEYTYQNKTLAKAEIHAKEIEGAIVTIEYKMVITNVGETEGTIEKIVDYLPDGLDFLETQSSSWNRNTDGELTNTSISNSKIEVGKSKELTLIATKQMTTNSVGTFTNKASIVEITDDNSENNTAIAQIIISVSTGATIYITIIIFIITLLSIVLIYLYKKGKIHFKKVNKTMGILIFMLTMILVSNSNILAYTGQVAYTYVLPWGSHQFLGGPTGMGNCGNHLLPPAGYIAGETSDKDEVVPSLYKYDDAKSIREGETVQTRTGDFTLELSNTEIDMRIFDNDNFIYGPFKFFCSKGQVDYTLDVRNSNNDPITDYLICRENGTQKNITTRSGEFYLKIPKASCSEGIVSVKLKATGTVKDHYNTPIYETPRYKSVDGEDTYQPVEACRRSYSR